MDRRTAKRRLNAERDRLEGLREGVRGDLMTEDPAEDGANGGTLITELSSQDQHPADMGSEMFEQEKNHSILSSLDGELQEVERALVRVADGTYGLCEACHRPIRAARLEAQPAARFCLEDQARAERELRAS